MNRMKKFIFLWVPALVWAGIIFYLSAQSGLSAGLSTPNEIIVRKIAHVTEFGVLAWLVWRIVYFGYGLNIKKSVIIAAIIAIVYSISDEFHQIFVSERKGMVVDVAVDTLGVALGLQMIVPVYVRKFKFFLLATSLATVTMLLFLVGRMVATSEENEIKRKMELRKQISASKQEAAIQKEIEEEKQVEIVENEEISEKNNADKKDKERISEPIPEQILIDVPFTPQAPFAVWDHVHDEACEEASLIMLRYYMEEETLSRETAEDEIQKMKEFQLDEYGHYEDSDMEELVEIAEKFYGINNLEVIYDFSKTELKRELSKGNPIIVPTAGRELGNPNYTHPGPLYHNLILIGYNGDTIVTNDPGTRRGEKYEYNIDVLYSAIHDFPGSKERIKEGRKAMIVVK